MKKLNLLFFARGLFAIACTPKVAETAAETTSKVEEKVEMVADNATEGNQALAIVQDYIDAMGGKDAIMKISNVKTEMEANTGMGAIEMKNFIKDGKYKMQVMAQGMTVQEITYDGARAMMDGMQGAQEVTDEKQLAGFAAQATVCPEMKYSTDGYTVTYEGEDKIKGKEVHVLKVITPQGATLTEYYSKEDKLKVRVVGEQEMQGQTQTVKTTMTDYKEVNGVKFPHSITISGPMPFDLNLEVTNLTVNGDMSDSLFVIE